MIEFEGVRFGYGPGRDVIAIDRLRIEPGLSLLLGPNGCGKSTLLRLAAGVEQPEAGEIRIAGHDLWVEEVAARAGLAYVPEHPELTPYATVGEVLRLVCRLRGEPEVRATEVLDEAGLRGLAARTIRELSQGQRRRAVQAAAHIGRPRVLLLDEPFEAMDRAMRERIRRWIEDAAAGEATVVVATHEYEPIAAVAARVLTLHDGAVEIDEPLPRSGDDRLRRLDELARGRRAGGRTM